MGNRDNRFAHAMIVVLVHKTATPLMVAYLTGTLAGILDYERPLSRTITAQIIDAVVSVMKVSDPENVL